SSIRRLACSSKRAPFGDYPNGARFEEQASRRIDDQGAEYKQHGGGTLLFDHGDKGGRVAAEAELEIDPDGRGQPYDQGAQTHEQTEVAPINVEAAVEDLAELHRSQIRGAQILR